MEEIIKELQLLGLDVTQTITESKIVFSNTAEDLTKSYVLGIDEAGRGPVLGPMVYAACFCTEDQYKDFSKQGFCDSKVLTESQREDLFLRIQTAENKKCTSWIAHSLSPQDISYGMLAKKKYNLNSLAHDTTIGLINRVLEQGYKISEIFVDTVGPPGSYNSKLSALFPGIKVHVAKKADSLYPIVSAASIVAKVIRDTTLKNWVFHENHESTFIDTNFGSGYPSDPTTKAWLTKNFDQVFGFPEIVRFSWSTCQRILAHKKPNVLYHDEHDQAPSKKPYPAKRNFSSTTNIFSTQNQMITTSINNSSFLKSHQITIWEDPFSF